MSDTQDTNNLINAYEKMYGRNTVEQVNEAIQNIDKPRKKRTRRGRRGSGKTKILQEKNTSNKDETQTIVKENTKIMSKKSKFDELFGKVYNEQFEAEGEVDIELEDPSLEGEGGLDDEGMGDEEVTLTIPREMADKLCELIMAAVDTGGDLEGELEGDDLGGEFDEVEGGDVDGFEEGMGEDSLSTAPDGLSKFTSKDHKVGANQVIGDQKHAGGRGASAAHGKAIPKPLAPQGK